MKLVAQVKLQPTPEQAVALKDTLCVANAACNMMSAVAHNEYKDRYFSRFALQKIVYHDVREQFKLPSQLTIRCVAKVASAYCGAKSSTVRRFGADGGIAFDDRNLTWHLDESVISISTVGGRQIMSYVRGARQRELLESRRGEADLLFRNGKWFLFATCEVDEPEPAAFDEALGVDMGVVGAADKAAIQLA